MKNKTCRNFCENNKEVINEEITNIKLNNDISTEDIKDKIKKTYKNRYYQIINKR